MRPTLPICLARLVLAGSSPARAQAKRILLVAHSWTGQAWSSAAFQTALANKGLGRFEVHKGPTTIGGAAAALRQRRSGARVVTVP